MKYRQSFWLSLVLIVIVVFTYSCNVNKSVAGRNVSFLYNNTAGVIGLQHKVYNSNSQSTLYLRINSSELAKDQNTTGNSVLNYLLRYRLYESYSDPVAIDSGSIIRREISVNDGQIIYDSLKVNTSTGRNYLIECVVKDLNSLNSGVVFADVFRSQQLNAQSLKVFDSSNQMVFETYLSQADSYTVVTHVPIERMYAKFYDREFQAAAPPFSTIAPKPFNFTPNAILELRKTAKNAFQLSVVKPGFYQLVSDTNQRIGATLFYFGPHYPEARTVLDLAQPIRYITTNEEFESVVGGGEIKRNVDAYWLRIGGNPERARELIRAYYSRVESANRFYSSFQEGWKTDRGMCYIVFGPPDIVKRSTSSEVWMYGEEGQYNSLTLTFTKVMNPFTNNDFRLNRSGILKTPWYRAVEFWRQGRVLTYR